MHPITRSLRAALAALAIAVAAAPLAAQRPATLTKADSAALLELAHEVDARWDARDARGFARLFTADADLEVAGEAVTRRIRGTIERDYTASFARADGTLRHRTIVDELHPVADGVVLVDARAWIVRAQGDSVVPLRAYTTRNVAVRTPDGWRLRVVRSHAEALDAPVMRDRSVAGR